MVGPTYIFVELISTFERMQPGTIANCDEINGGGLRNSLTRLVPKVKYCDKLQVPSERAGTIRLLHFSNLQEGSRRAMFEALQRRACSSCPPLSSLKTAPRLWPGAGSKPHISWRTYAECPKRSCPSLTHPSTQYAAL